MSRDGMNDSAVEYRLATVVVAVALAVSAMGAGGGVAASTAGYGGVDAVAQASSGDGVPGSDVSVADGGDVPVDGSGDVAVGGAASGDPLESPGSDDADGNTSQFAEYGDSKVIRGTKDKFGGAPLAESGLQTNKIRQRRYEVLDTAQTCSTGREVSYDVSAIDVTIPLNKFGDHDPLGRMYVLDENIDDVRAQEQSMNVSTGLRDDPIQPLVIRANLGDCVSIHFTNRLDDTASIHIHRGTIPPGESGSNVGNNANTMVSPGSSTTYTFDVENDQALEGTWYMHSHGNREQVEHGLFGALMIEPKGSIYLDPQSREPQKSGWEAIIDNENESIPSYREFAIFYHTIGDDNFQPLNGDGDEIPIVDDVTGVYRPCTKALNYRSECHRRRMQLLANQVNDSVNPSDIDESLGYSTYTFGDPPTPIPQTYMGDPTKFRILNGGSEVRHVHHLHGGGIRWRFQPSQNLHEKAMFQNLTKVHGNDTQSASQRLDSQGLGPGEAYTNEIACGGGGCQRSAGDFLFHCHLADHYVGGMWTFWRNFDTLQDGLAQLPDREGETPEAVDSTELLGTELPDGTVLTEDNIDEWVEQQLPPQGVPDGYDAQVWNWAVENTTEGPLYLGEPLDTEVWPNYDAGAKAGERPVIEFNPENGRIAYPLLTPHLGHRPPYAPGGHGPAPYLSAPPDDFNDLTTNSNHSTVRADPQIGDDQLCPAGSPIKRFNLVAIDKLHEFAADREAAMGEFFVLAENKQAVLNGEQPARPLVYRANVGDCVTLTLTSELQDNEINNNFSKVNIHPHFIQFDTQASDGVITGRNYETSVRNHRIVDTELAKKASAGKKKIQVEDASGYHEGATFAVGLGADDIEVHRIAQISQTSNTITFEEPLVRDHPAGTSAGVEFVRYKYFVDANFGTVFFHDHVNAIHSFPRGLVGALVIEPRNSTYHDPQSGDKIRSGPLADVRTNTSNRISRAAGSQGESFREFVAVMAADRHEDIGVGGWINMRAEPFADRDSKSKDLVLSSVAHGDPYTHVVRAYEGDPVVFRTLDGAANEKFSFRVTGHEFRLEHFPNATPRQAVHLGPSERFDLMIDGGAGEAGDYLYYVGKNEEFRDGMWGVFRVHDTRQADLQPLPDRPEPPAGDGFPSLEQTGERPPQPDSPGQPCPSDAPVEQFDVTAFAADVHFNEDEKEDVAMFALDENVEAIEDEKMNPMPLVMRANVGDCVEVTVTNDLDARVSLHLGQTETDPQRSSGITVGYNYDQSVDVGDSRTYRVFIEDEDMRSGLLADFSLAGHLSDTDVYESGNLYGLYGAIVAAPKGATFHDPETGTEVQSGWNVVVDEGDSAYRDYVLVMEERSDTIGTHQMPYRTEARGLNSINYRFESMVERIEDSGTAATVFDSGTHGDPATPLLEAYSGDDVRIHVVSGTGFQTGVFSINGHSWKYDEEVDRSTRFSDRGYTTHRVIEIRLAGGAGPPGDYLYSNHRQPMQRSGQWGILRVYDSGAGNIKPLCEFTGDC